MTRTEPPMTTQALLNWLEHAPSDALPEGATLITQLPPRENAQLAALISGLRHAGASVHRPRASELDLL